MIGFLHSFGAQKYYEQTKSAWPHATWVHVPALVSPATIANVHQTWEAASRELTNDIARLMPKGTMDGAVIAAGRNRAAAALAMLNDPNTSIDDAVDAIVSEFTNVAGYPSLGSLVEKSKLTGAKRDQLAKAVRDFEDASFSAAMSAVALLENADHVGTDKPDETLAKLRLVDTADRLYELVGDPPDGLRINPSEDPAGYVDYACKAIKMSGLSDGRGPETFQEQITRALRAYAVASSEAETCGAVEGVTEVMSQLAQTARTYAVPGRFHNPAKAEGAAELGMVFTEAVRQVAGLPARGDGTPRPARPDANDMRDCEDLARDAVTRIVDDERERDHDHDGR